MKVDKIRVIAEVILTDAEKRILHIAAGSMPKKACDPIETMVIGVAVKMRLASWEQMSVEIDKHGCIPMNKESCMILAETVESATGFTLKDQNLANEIVAKFKGLSLYLKTETPSKL